MAEIVPTILTADFDELSQKIKSLEGIVPRVQIDIIDGQFVANKTVSLEVLKELETGLKIDLHLMVKEPEDWLNHASEILPDRIIGQIEMMGSPLGFIKKVVDEGAQVGIALDLPTAVEAVSEEIYQSVDLVLVMAVSAGFAHQKFDERAIEKIKKIKAIVGNLVEIAVDGGLDEKTLSLCKKAGGEIFYVSSNFWLAENLQLKYQQLTKLLS